MQSNNIARYIKLKPYFINIVSKYKDYINQTKLKKIYNR